MSLLDHQELMIVKGVPPIPGYTSNTETPLVIVDLLTPNSAFALIDWTPNIPSLKSGGTWADSSITDGRTLIAGVNTNVIETITVQLTGSTAADFASQFAKLQRMIQNARDFWDEFTFIEPVYIRWWANCAPGPQFALIYNIDMDVEWNDSNRAQAKLTLSIEREVGWRGHVAPGENPRKWSVEMVYNRKFNSTTYPLLTDGLNLAVNTALVNRTEYATTNKQTYTTQNFIDVSGTLIPGDLPALTCIIVNTSETATPAAHTVYVSRKSVPSNQILSSVDVLLQSMMLNAGDMTLGANTTFAVDTGAPLSQSTGTRRRAVFTPVDNLDNVRLTVANRATLNHRGRYAVFCRCRQSAGLAGEISMYLAYGNTSPYTTRTTTTPVNPTVQAGAGNTTYWPVTYMGIIENPINTPAANFFQGSGPNYQAGDWDVQLWARRTAGAAAVLLVADFVLIPIDEPSTAIVSTNTGLTWEFAMDTTGHFQHGKTGYFAASTGGTASGNASDVRGQGIYLLPGVNQRLYFFSLFADNTSDLINYGFTASVNIVPRWSGIRDK